MRVREEQILKAILYLKEKTEEFSKPRLIMTGGYGLRAFVKFSRYTREGLELAKDLG